MAVEEAYWALRSNFENNLVEALKDSQDGDGLSLTDAFNRVTANWIGYELDEDNFVDGAGDRGIDFWYLHNAGFDIFQTKTHALSKDLTINRSLFDGSGISDLQRARDFLLDEGEIDVQNSKLRRLKSKWDFEIRGRSEQKGSDPILANLNLVLLGDGLTRQAEKEYDAFGKKLGKLDYVGGVPIQFQLSLYTLETLIDTRWREENREWRDKAGKKRKTINLHPSDLNYIGTSKDIVFYCLAVDLVTAYEDFGYQLFEPNVRAHISRSKVNAAIEASVKRRVSRRDFRLLNNGVTISCAGYSKPSENNPAFRVREPGIVNGLQTVVALHSGYEQLSHSDKEDFEKNCLVLVRVLQRNAVTDINKLVLATNTQNPMQPRNLVSNRSEQVFYERLFADKGWFYERKQGAWDAFSADPKSWRSLSNKTRKDFQASGGRGRAKYRRVGNDDLAQTWLSFIGFSNEATNFKRDLFDEKWYEFIFLQQPKAHGYTFQYSVDRAKSESINKAPDADLLLLAWCAANLHKAAAPTAKSNRDEAEKRLDLDTTSLSKIEIDVELAKDKIFTLGQVLRGSSMLFVETLGYVLFRALGTPYGRGKIISSSELVNEIKEKFDLANIANVLETDSFDPSDWFAVVWKAYMYITNNLVESTWAESYRAAAVKSRFLLSLETRRRFVKEFDELDSYFRRRELPRFWASEISPDKGLFGFLESKISS